MLNTESLALLFSNKTRRNLVVAVIGSALLALADSLGVIAILPLMQLLSGSPQDEGLLGWVSDLLGDPSYEALAISLAAITFGAFLVKGIGSIGFRWWLAGFVARQEADTSINLLRYYLTAPYGLHLRRSSADLIRTMNDAVRSVYFQVVTGGMNIISEAFAVLAVSATLIVLTPGPALLLLVYFAVAGGLFYWVLRPMAKHAGERTLSSWLTIYQGAMHALGGIKEITIRHKAGYFLDSYARSRHEYAHAQRTVGFLGELPKYVFEVLFILGIGLVTIFVFSTGPDSGAIGVLAILAAAGFRLLPSAVRLVASMNMVRLGQPSLEVVVEDLRASRAVDNARQATNPPGITQPAHPGLLSEIRLDGVTFTHEGRDQPAVKDVSFHVPAGTAVALVGPSGAGKSTIVDIILGLYAPSSGRVTTNGIDVRSILPEWQQSLGLVPQEVYLLDDDLRANIAFGEPRDKLDEARLNEAIAGAQLEGLVASLPEGLDTFVGERGVRLSGGQRQRIGIARALYTRPRLLILDEATSALDNETERRIAQTIQALHGNVTIVIVAHRLSTVRNCDQVVFLSEGQVAAIGDFETLQLMNADFARLVELGSLK